MNVTDYRHTYLSVVLCLISLVFAFLEPFAEIGRQTCLFGSLMVFFQAV